MGYTYDELFAMNAKYIKLVSLLDLPVKPAGLIKGLGGGADMVAHQHVGLLNSRDGTRRLLF